MTQRHDDDLGRQIEREPTIHKMRQGDLPAMPWHTPDKPFGVSQEEWDKRDKPDWAAIMNTGAHYGECRCGEPASIVLDRPYCQECWDIGDDEDA